MSSRRPSTRMFPEILRQTSLPWTVFGSKASMSQSPRPEAEESIGLSGPSRKLPDRNSTAAGPIRTLAGAGISDARTLFHYQQRHAPMHRSPTLDEVGGAALYLLSDLSGAVTGEIHFVDCGYSTIAMPNLVALKTLEQAEELEAAVEKATPREAAQ